MKPPRPTGGPWGAPPRAGGEDPDTEVRLVHPYQAIKRYRCPACGHAIEVGTGHYVVVPRCAPDLRRHWHRGCWERQRGQVPK